jgi:TPP-dependent pyruvate/acetoin dehydrogenase alpha subunit
MKRQTPPKYHFYPSDASKVIAELGKETLLQQLKKMLLIRNFEIRAEAAYLQGKIGGFFHSYMGQEAVQTSAVFSMSAEQWWITSYRCHALALLLGATPNELMARGVDALLHGASFGRIWDCGRTNPYCDWRCLYDQLPQVRA